MVSHEDGRRLNSNSWKTYSRSVSWTDGSPTNPNPRSVPNTKSRPCLPPLQPLLIGRRSVQGWPKASSDDLGVWPNPKIPGDFELKRDKLAFFDKECSRIAEHIYLGSDAVAKNREVLRQNGITHVLNCVGFVCREYFKSDLVYKTLWLRDTPSEDITSILYDVFDYFEDVREKNGRVFVHCCQGISRSSSLVIAYLMWREGRSFEDAFQYVKAARGVTNPNMGFAYQLLQCQKRVLAMPTSPSSLLRMYRMAPHSSYDPLHLVPKMLDDPGPGGLDSRGAFIVHVPAAIYIWVGKNCKAMMADQAKIAANQVVRYERARGPIVVVYEDDEPLEFWGSLARRQLVPKDGDASTDLPRDGDTRVDPVDRTGEKRVREYDLDFEIFDEVLSSGIIPPLPVSNSESEICLPAREDGWGRLREKFGVLKELLISCSSSSNRIVDSCDIPQSLSLDPAPSPASSSAYACQSPNSFIPFQRIISSERTEEIFHDSLPSPSSPRIHRSMSSDSFSHFLPGFSPKSSTLSPSTSDSTSSFTFSPTSSNWSETSSCQPSPSGFRPTTNQSPCKTDPLLHNPSPSCQKSSHVRNINQPSRVSLPSIAERRGSLPPSLMVLPPADEVLAHNTDPVQTGSDPDYGPMKE